jgi:hypothetical protein
LPAVAAQRSGVEASWQSGSLRARSVRQMMSAGSGCDGSPRTALNAASCGAKARVGLKNRNGLSTSHQIGGVTCIGGKGGE